MNRLARLCRTSIGCKLVMAVTGVMLLGFVIGHLLGNLQVFQGEESLDAYAKALRSMPEALWTARIGLMVVFATHIYAAFRLYLQNKEARPVSYHHEETVKASFASRHMLLSGLVVLAFVIYHLLHFTFRVIEPGDMARAEVHEVHRMVYTSFQTGWVALSYVIAMLLLGVHLIHGTASVFQTIGWRNRGIQSMIAYASGALTGLIVLGNCLIPVAIYFGWI